MKKYAKISWCIEDIHCKRKEFDMPKWTNRQAGEFLASLENSLEEAMCFAGWDLIENELYQFM